MLKTRGASAASQGVKITPPRACLDRALPREFAAELLARFLLFRGALELAEAAFAASLNTPPKKTKKHSLPPRPGSNFPPTRLLRNLESLPSWLPPAERATTTTATTPPTPAPCRDRALPSTRTACILPSTRKKSDPPPRARDRC